VAEPFHELRTEYESLLAALEEHIKAPGPGRQSAHLCRISASVGIDVDRATAGRFLNEQGVRTEDRDPLLHAMPLAVARSMDGARTPFDVRDRSGGSVTATRTGGVFVITYDGEVIWERKTDGGFPDVKQLKQRVRDYLDPDRDLGHLDRLPID
jgi:selT/selW/selH-like putative selenoprotein